MYDTCMDVNQLDRIGIFPLKKLIKDIGDSKITSKEWESQKYNVYDAIIQTKRSLNFDLFFRIGVWINPKNSSRHAFFVSVDYGAFGINFILIGSSSYAFSSP